MGDGEAVHLMHQYVPRHHAARVQDARRARVSMLTLLRRHGVATHSLELNISAVGADLHAATHMGIPVGTPILVTRRLSAGPDGQLVECFWSLTRPEKRRMRTIIATTITALAVATVTACGGVDLVGPAAESCTTAPLFTVSPVEMRDLELVTVVGSRRTHVSPECRAVC